MEIKNINKGLIKYAIKAMANSYAPYSGYTVGAAVMCSDGMVYRGCNVENASFGATMCAERCAISSAIANGRTDFVKIAIVGGKTGLISEFFRPCGICRQTLREFCDDDFEIILYDGKEEKTFKLGELYPESFCKDDITIKDQK